MHVYNTQAHSALCSQIPSARAEEGTLCPETARGALFPTHAELPSPWCPHPGAKNRCLWGWGKAFGQPVLLLFGAYCWMPEQRGGQPGVPAAAEQLAQWRAHLHNALTAFQLLGKV